MFASSFPEFVIGAVGRCRTVAVQSVVFILVVAPCSSSTGYRDEVGCGCDVARLSSSFAA